MVESPLGLTCWRVPTKFNPDRSCLDHIFVVEPQCDYCRPTCRHYSNHVGSGINPSKLVSPSLRSRVEQRRKLSSFRIDRISFRPLKLVAAVAGGSQVTTIITPAQRSRQNVFHHQRCSGQPRGSLAIFAAMV